MEDLYMGRKSGCGRNHYYIVLKQWMKALFKNRGTGTHELRLKPHQSDVYKAMRFSQQS